MMCARFNAKVHDENGGGLPRAYCDYIQFEDQAELRAKIITNVSFQTTPTKEEVSCLLMDLWKVTPKDIIALIILYLPPSYTVFCIRPEIYQFTFYISLHPADETPSTKDNDLPFPTATVMLRSTNNDDIMPASIFTLRLIKRITGPPCYNAIILRAPGDFFMQIQSLDIPFYVRSVAFNIMHIT
jgi:hypothetical protein